MNSIAIHIRRQLSQYDSKLIGLFLLYIAISGYFLRTYLIWQSVNCIMGLMAVLVVAQPNPSQVGNRRYAYFLIVFALLSYFVQIRTFVFFGVIGGVYFLVEQRLGKIDRLAFLVALFMCPFFQYAMNVFSFPIRLWLTGIAGDILTAAGVECTVNGSVIVCRGQDFLVDTACMGLKMLVSSLLISTVILSVYEKKFKKYLNWKPLSTYIILVVVFNIIANLFRIVLIVQFAILPSSVFHDIVGLICFIAYVLLPTWLLVKWVVAGKMLKPAVIKPTVHKKPVPIFFHLCIMTLLVGAAIMIEREGKLDMQTNKQLADVEGYKALLMPNHTIKMENSQSLIYFKQMENFFTLDHNPMVCWRGSGFELSEVSTESISGKQVYVATLRNKEDRLYTAWWFDNGKKHTVNQLEFRLDMLKTGSKYSLVNITCASKANLFKEIDNMHTNQIIQKIIQ